MTDPTFVGREYEQSLLNNLLSKKVASLVVIKGRRRIGKSRLVQEFARNKKFYVFSGLPPTKKITAQMQRDEFARQLSMQTGLPEVKADDWSKLFVLFADKTKRGRVVILFDEISWMAAKDPNFLGKLKNTWDLHFKNNPQLILILCGSVSSWIEKNILSSTGFFGRISLKLTLEPLLLKECDALLTHIGFKRSPLEKLLILSFTGGIPWYIELINPGFSAMENIKKLCFEKDGVLVGEFDFIFHELYGRRWKNCKQIVEYLANGSAQYAEIANALNYPSSGALSAYLRDLLTSGFITKDTNWHLKTAKDAKLSKFRLSDNYLRFYLKYIEPQLNKIIKNQFQYVSFTSFSNWEGIMGLQFENVVLNNRKLVFECLGLRPDEIVFDNPFFQTKTTKQKGCQIDYLIQTKHHTLFVCEIKFSKHKANPSVVGAVQEKISKMAVPQGYACLPVLINVSGVTEEVIEKNYFYRIINFTQFLS